MGSSTELVIFRQKVRPSDDDTLHPLTTFHKSFMSSLLDGSRIASSCTPRGNRPGAAPIALGLWNGLLSFMLGEYGLLLMIALGICVGLACVG